MDKNELVAAIEAVLFVHAEPISIEKLEEIFKIPCDEILTAVGILKNSLNEDNSGLKLITVNNKYQLCTKSEYGEYIKSALVIKRNSPLSQAALEILAIIAYNQPVTKAFVEQIRGVDCAWGISGLIDKDLIQEQGRLNLPGRPLTYGTTDNFLRCLKISSIDELPDIKDFSDAGEAENAQIKLPLQAE